MSQTQPNQQPAANWVLDELAHAGRENRDVTHAWRYDDKEDADAAREVSLLQQVGLTRNSVVVDLGAGTGQFALTAAPACRQLIAVDVSPVMLKPLSAKIAAAGVDNIVMATAGFLTYEHVGDPVDVVYSRFALHHLPDFWKVVALHRARRMMRPGGVLRLWDVVFSFAPHETEQRIEAWCAAYDNAAEGQWSRGDVEEHVRDEHSTFSWLLEPMIERCGFALVDTEYTPDGLFAKYLARAK